MKIIFKIGIITFTCLVILSCRKTRKGVCEIANVKSYKPTSINAKGSIASDDYFVLTTVSESECNGENNNFYKGDSYSEEIKVSHWWENESAKSLGTNCCGYNSKSYSNQPGSEIIPPSNGFYKDMPEDFQQIYTPTFQDLSVIGVKYGLSQTSVPSPTTNVGSGKCFVGNWRRTLSCNSSITAYLTVNASGTGNLSDNDCNGTCSRSFDFNWVDNNDGTLKITYTKGNICGTSTIPNGGNQSYTCNGTSLTWGNVYQKY